MIRIFLFTTVCLLLLLAGGYSADDQFNQNEYSEPYGENVVSVGQKLKFKKFTLSVQDIFERDNRKHANFHFVNTSTNTGIVSIGESHYVSLDFFRI